MADSLHTARFPNESEEYRAARTKLLMAEGDLRRRNEEVAAHRLPLGGQGDQIPALNVFVRRGDWHPRLAY